MTDNLKWPDDFINKVICGDSLEIIKKIPEDSISSVITDPPYNVSGNPISLGDMGYETLNEDWDINFDPIPILEESVRVTSPSANLLFFCTRHLLGKYLNWRKTREIIHWIKGNPMPAICKIYTPTVEYVCWWTMGSGYTFNRLHMNRNVIESQRCMGAERSNHPTQKPLSVMRHLISVHTNQDDIILDPYAGSGSTLVAAKQLGRRYIGIEISSEYCKIADERLSQEELAL